MGSAADRPIHVLLAGTDPRVTAGGVSAALRGARAALDAVGIEASPMVTHLPGRPGGKVGPWLDALRRVTRWCHRARAAGAAPVVWAHAGGWPSLARKAAVLRAARGGGAHTLVQLHGAELDAYLASRPGRAMVRRWLEPADRVAVPAAWWRDRVGGAIPGVDPRVVPNALEPALERVAAAPAPRRRVVGPGLTALVLSRLVPGKGVGVAIDAVAGCPADVRLVIAGDGPALRSLRRRARRAGVSDRVRFVGWVGPTTRASLLRDADLLCHPSTFDAWPTAIAEAMAYGLPVVAADRRAVPEMVAHGVTGWLVPGDDPAAVARALLQLRDPAERARLGERGRQDALRRWGAAVVGASLRRLLEGLTATPRAPAG